jgi:hypothetical protein
MRIDIPPSAVMAGFRCEPAGTHTSRTIMLGELQELLDAVPPGSVYACYQAAAVELNAVHKATRATREKTFRHLRELYALSPHVLLFRTLADLWGQDAAGRPLLAVLCAAARDPLLRAASERILEAQGGERVTSLELAQAVELAFPGRFRPDTLARTGRNLASSFTQSGHLVGRTGKLRACVTGTPAATTYALLLGYMCGARGDALFQTVWASLCDAPGHVLRSHAETSAKLGYLEYRHAGGVTEVGFQHLLRAEGTA